MSNFRVRVIILLSSDLGQLGHVRFFQICHAFVLSRGNDETEISGHGFILVAFNNAF
jgi:hypothetical protein